MSVAVASSRTFTKPDAATINNAEPTDDTHS